MLALFSPKVGKVVAILTSMCSCLGAVTCLIALTAGWTTLSGPEIDSGLSVFRLRNASLLPRWLLLILILESSIGNPSRHQIWSRRMSVDAAVALLDLNVRPTASVDPAGFFMGPW